MGKIRTSGGVRDPVAARLMALLSGDDAVQIYADPAARREVRAGAALLVLAACKTVQVDLAALLDEAAGVARESGASWDEIGSALGITRQAAHKRFNGGKQQ